MMRHITFSRFLLFNDTSNFFFEIIWLVCECACRCVIGSACVYQSDFWYVCLSVCPYIGVFVCFFVGRSVSLSVDHSIYLSASLCVSLLAGLSLCLSITLSICLRHCVFSILMPDTQKKWVPNETECIYMRQLMSAMPTGSFICNRTS